MTVVQKLAYDFVTLQVKQDFGKSIVDWVNMVGELNPSHPNLVSIGETPYKRMRYGA
jgi:hypothetical protein